MEEIIQINFYVYAITIRAFAMIGGLFVLYTSYRLFEKTCFRQVEKTVEANIKIVEGELNFTNISVPGIMAILGVVIILAPYIIMPSLEYSNKDGTDLALKSSDRIIQNTLEDARKYLDEENLAHAGKLYVESFKYSVKSNDKAIESLLGLGKIMKDQGKKGQAIAFFALAESLGANSQVIKVMMEGLEEG